jgi:sugar phosphate isomerase/epimerase
MPNTIAFTVFTKPWKMPIIELGPFVKGLGFAGVELPVRHGYPVNPENAATELPKAARTLAESDLKIVSVAGSTDEATVAACGEAGVPILRIMAPIAKDSGYLEQETQLLRQYDALLPALERHQVTLGIQHHTGRYVTNAAGLRRLVERYNPRQVGAVWDPAHCALSGELPDLAIDLLWSHLCLVNLKNGFWRRTNGPEAEVAQYGHYWTSGRQGQCSWAAVAALLQQRAYQGYICLCAEYSNQEEVNRLITEDLAFAQTLFV